jgi:uncharacterized protein YndB with AHSA1/START domain
MPETRASGTLEVTLPSDTEILLRRTFDAPRHLVFEALTKPEYVRRWWCWQPGATMPVCDIDFRVGGTYRYVTRSADGEVAFNGVFQEITPPERYVHTEVFEMFPDNPTLVTVTLEERGGKTYYSSLTAARDKATRDLIASSGMEVGAAACLDLVEQIARELRK